MMAGDLTKTSSHIIWLWAAILALTGLFGRGYLALRASDEYLAEKINASEMTIKIQLAEINSNLVSLDVAIQELKQDIKKRNEPSVESALFEIKRDLNDLKRRKEP